QAYTRIAVLSTRSGKEDCRRSRPPCLATLMPGPVAASMRAPPWPLLVCLLRHTRGTWPAAHRRHQAAPTPSQGRYINREDDISTSSSCPDAADDLECLANRRYHLPSAAGTVLA